MSKRRVINELRRLYPQGKWVYDTRFHAWSNAEVGTVVAVSHHSPMYDGDDDRYLTRYQLNYPTGPYLPFDGGLHDSYGYKL